MNAFDREQAQTAERLGYGADVGAMNRDHDPLHLALCAWLGVPCVGLPSSPDHRPGGLAGVEEDAVLAVQKLMRAHGASVPPLMRGRTRSIGT